MTHQPLTFATISKTKIGTCLMAGLLKTDLNFDHPISALIAKMFCILEAVDGLWLGVSPNRRTVLWKFLDIRIIAKIEACLYRQILPDCENHNKVHTRK